MHQTADTSPNEALSGGARTEDEGGDFSFGKLLGVLRRRWRLIAAGSVVGAVAGYAWMSQAIPFYTATTTILIDVQKSKLMQSESVVSEMVLDTANLATELSRVQSFAVARGVVERLALADDPDFNRKPKAAGLMSQIKSLIVGKAEAEKSQGEQQAARKTENNASGGLSSGGMSRTTLAAINGVRYGTQVQRVGSTWFFNISFTHLDPKAAARVANGVAEMYVEARRAARNDAANRATEWLRNRMTALREKVESSAREVAEFRAAHNLLTPSGGTLSDQQALAINADLVTVHADAVQKRARYEQARGILQSGKIDSVSEIMASPSIASLRGLDAQASHEEADLLTRYGPEHPEVRKVRAQRADLKRQMSAEVARVVSTLKTDYELAQKKEESLDKSLRDLNGDGGVRDQAVIRLRELESEARADKALYESILTRFKEVEQQASLPIAETLVVSPAQEPDEPNNPNKTRMFAMGLLGGLLAGAGLSFLLEKMQTGFTTSDEVERALHLPVMSMLPVLTERERMFEGAPLAIADYVAKKPLSRFSEGVRAIRVSAQFSGAGKPAKLVLVTSSAPHEGKSTLTQCLAYSAATGGQRVLVMDCDLRHPSLSNKLRMTGNLGITDLLLGQATEGQVFVDGPHANLTVAPAGSLTRHPPDVLGSERLPALLEDMRSRYDLILLDAPPVMPVIDSTLLSRLVDKIIFVVNWRSTPSEVVAGAISALGESRSKVAGIALNNVQPTSASSYSSAYNYYDKQCKAYYEQ